MHLPRRQYPAGGDVIKGFQRFAPAHVFARLAPRVFAYRLIDDPTLAAAPTLRDAFQVALDIFLQPHAGDAHGPTLSEA
jgi:hypothetical protein